MKKTPLLHALIYNKKKFDDKRGIQFVGVTASTDESAKEVVAFRKSGSNQYS